MELVVSWIRKTPSVLSVRIFRLFWSQGKDGWILKRLAWSFFVKDERSNAFDPSLHEYTKRSLMLICKSQELIALLMSLDLEKL